MSIYIPNVWKNGTTPSINAKNLNEMEAGVLNAHREIDDMITGVTPVGRSVTAITAETVKPATRFTLGGVKIWVDLTDPANPIGYIGT